MPPPAIGTSLRSMQFDLRTRTHSFFRWPQQTRNWRNGAGPGLRSSNIPPRPEEMIAGQVTDGVRRIAHTCILLSRACQDMATARGLEQVAIDLMAKAKEFEELYAQ